MSDATLSDPQVRATQNRWYLYNSVGDPTFGGSAHVRAVIEEVCDEILNGDGGPKRTMRNVFLYAEDVREIPRQKVLEPPAPAAHDALEEKIENEMTDEQFRELIDNGTIIPISVPQ